VWIDQRNCVKHLTDVDRRIESEWMPRLIMNRRTSGGAFVYKVGDTRHVPVQPIDAPPVDRQPAAAINPLPPFAVGRYHIAGSTVPIIEFDRQRV